MVASRTQETILEEMGAEPTGPRRGARAQAAPRPGPSSSPTAVDRAGVARAASLHEVARGLLGWTLLHDGVGGRIVEVEAYAPDDPASHAFRGRTPRNGVDVRPAGNALRLPLVRRPLVRQRHLRAEGVAAAVLLRALEPTPGLDEMRRRRGSVARPRSSAPARGG